MSIYFGCSKGYRYNYATDECVICPNNTYSNTTNAESCTSCPTNPYPTHPNWINYVDFISEEGSSSRSDCGKKHLYIKFLCQEVTQTAYFDIFKF